MADLATAQDFAQAAQTANLVGMGISMTFDHETAISLADRFSDEDDFFLLESATSGAGKRARYSFMGFQALWAWESSRTSASLRDGASCTRSLGGSGPNPIAAFYAEFKGLSAAHIFARSPVGFDAQTLSGAVGFIGYDTAASLEPSIGTPPPAELGLPATYFMVPRYYLILDQLTHRLYALYYCRISDRSPSVLAAQHAEACKALLALTSKLSTDHRAPALRLHTGPLNLDAMTSRLQAAEFYAKAEKCLNDIRRGDIFQIQIGNRLSKATSARPFDMFRHLRILNPSPYMFFMRWQGSVLFGASPEMMVGVEEGRITHRPIAGTRKRTWVTADDERRKEELTTSVKERAEHVMLVDLSRNDVGRIAIAGSVRVSDLMVVEEYSHVFHMVSQVQGELLPGLTAADAMAASFPNGTVSGAPKIKAMELIYRYEPIAREFYAGSLGMFTFSGDLKSTLLIRSVCVQDGVAYTQASAGMVYDSVPEHEWQETRHKMAACVTAIQHTL